MADRKRATAKIEKSTAKRMRHIVPSASLPTNTTRRVSSSRLTNDSYTVGWICALEIELAASVAMLDEKLPTLPQAPGDSNTYVLGRIGEHNVVFVCLPAGTTGTNAAATAATNLLRSFPKIRFGLMVGIGGGAPSPPSDDPHKDLRLGDVVVSCPTVNSGGVLQYDFGKTMRDGKFVQTGSLNKTSTALRTGISVLQARHRIEGSEAPRYIDDMLRLNGKMRETFDHPGFVHDQLFRVDYEHVEEKADCQSCDRRALLLRKDRTNRDPVIHYGLIGSANQVMKHGITREKLRQEKGIICFEMEAAGLMDSLPCLVIRGICDYADSHKNKRWQPYAAAAAAACAKEVLNLIPIAEAATPYALDKVAFYHMLQSAINEMTLSQLLDMLLPVDQDQYISAIPCLDRDNTMFCWVFRNIDFRNWSSAEGSSVLCLLGPPECHIYQVASYIVDQEKKANNFVLYLFCSAVNEGGSIVPTFVHTLLEQIIRQSPIDEKAIIIQNFFSNVLRMTFPEEEVPNWKQLGFDDRDLLKSISKICHSVAADNLLTALTIVLDYGKQRFSSIVIDGMDTIDQAGELISCIRALIEHLKQRRPTVKILLTSQPLDDIMIFFQEFPCIEYDKERKECLASLHFDNARYNKISQEHRGSLEWIWGHTEYRTWSNSGASRLLYIQGKPGSGKSTFLKYFHHNLLKWEPAAHLAIITRFFYSLDGELQKSHYNMLLSILYDVLYQDEAFFYHQCQAEYRAHPRCGSTVKWDYASLKTVLRSLQNYTTTRRLYLIIDAVDESQESDRRDILNLLIELCSKTKYCVVKVCVASRPVAQLEARREQFHYITLQDETRSDINNFASSLLDGLSITRLLAQATKYILENAQGVFLWVSLVGEELIRFHDEGYSEEEIFELLKQLPTELEDVYVRMLQKMHGNKSSLSHGIKIFRLILFARRPLTVDELLHALGIPDDLGSEGQFILTDDSFEKRVPSSERFIISCGGNFLEIKQHEGKKTVQFMHETAREFFLDPNGCVAKSKFWSNEREAHIYIAITCIRYLLLCMANTSVAERLPDVGSWTTAQYKIYAQYLDKRPLASYALCYIKYHIDINGQDANIDYAVTQFMKSLTDGPATHLLESWAGSQLNQHSLNERRSIIARDFNDQMLRVAVLEGFGTTAEILLSVGADFEKEDEYGRTLLSWAAGNGHQYIVKLLLERGANVDLEDYRGLTPLSWATGNGYWAIVELLQQNSQ